MPSLPKPWRVLAAGEHFQPGAETVRILEGHGAEVFRLDRFRCTEAEMMEAMAAINPVALLVGIQPVTEQVMAAAPALRVISRYGAGYDQVDVGAATRRGICVTYEPDSNTVSVAELTFGLILGAARGIVRGHQDLQAGRWARQVGIELAGRTLGIIGLGRIGKAVARRAVAFDMRVIACDIVQDPSFAGRWGIEYVTLERVLAESDIVSLHVPLTPLTRGMIGAAELARIKVGAMLVNTARGPVADAAAVVDAVRSGRIQAAMFDAYDTEPPMGSPVIGVEGILTTPHLGAYTAEGLRRMLVGAASSLLAVLGGTRPPNALNPEALERMKL